MVTVNSTKRFGPYSLPAKWKGTEPCWVCGDPAEPPPRFGPYLCPKHQQERLVDQDNWKHRSAGMRCRTCIYFVPKKLPLSNSPGGTVEPADSTLGRCRRHAPTMSGWPAVFQTDWCGDHKLDEQRVAQ